MFAGFVQLSSTLNGAFLTKNSSGVPTNADTLPTFRVYGPDGLMQNGTGTATVLDAAVPGLYAYAVSVDPNDGYEVGTCYTIVISGSVSSSSVGYEQSFIVA